MPALAFTLDRLPFTASRDVHLASTPTGSPAFTAPFTDALTAG